MSTRPTVEVVEDTEWSGMWHININMPLVSEGTTVFVSLAEHGENNNRYTDLELRDGNVTVLGAGGS